MTKLKRIGGDLVLLIDPDVAARVGMTEDSVVRVTVRDETLHIEPTDEGLDSPDGPGSPPQQDA